MFLQVSLNGSRTKKDHPAIPVTPLEMAQAVKSVYEAGAPSVHLHARDETGRESLQTEAVATTLTAIRQACPNIELALSTAENIEGDPQRRLRLIEQWTVFPDTLCVNLSEEGIDEVIALAHERGLSFEAGLFSPEDVKHFKSLQHVQWRRVLLEPLSTNLEEAHTQLSALRAALGTPWLDVPHVIHAMDEATYPLLQTAAQITQASRIGFEDTLYLPDGSLATDNTQLFLTALALMEEQRSIHRAF
jgi:uncharacterized protein (DUF849 family)